jgi:hypothetical protein
VKLRFPRNATHHLRFTSCVLTAQTSGHASKPRPLDNNLYNHQRSHVRRPGPDKFILEHTTSGQTFC